MSNIALVQERRIAQTKMKQIQKKNKISVDVMFLGGKVTHL